MVITRGAAGFWVEMARSFILWRDHHCRQSSRHVQPYRGGGSDEDERSSLKTGSVLVEQMKLAGTDPLRPIWNMVSSPGDRSTHFQV